MSEEVSKEQESARLAVERAAKALSDAFAALELVWPAPRDHMWCVMGDGRAALLGALTPRDEGSGPLTLSDVLDLDDCPGAGGCHGAAKWCPECGTCEDCDDTTCDAHRKEDL